ncbi:MAG: hypothetical protein L0G36_02185, partial [Brevibacterium sp.]|nr:hypothetical protein [Brevibacterium sp.]
VGNVVTGSRHEQTELDCESMSDPGLVQLRSRRNSELPHAGCELVGGQVLVNECSKPIQVNRIRERAFDIWRQGSVLCISALGLKIRIGLMLAILRQAKVIASGGIKELNDVNTLALPFIQISVELF